MATWLDIVGSFIIGGIIILILVNLNLFINSSSQENLYTNIVQESLSTTSEVLEHDFYRIGSAVSGSKIALADSNAIMFYGDVSDSGKIDTVYYYLGSTTQLSATPNPNDRIMYRVANNATPLPTTTVNEFKLVYYDSAGTELSYAALVNATQRDKIKSLEIYLKVESPQSVDGVYQAAEWQRKIFPKNL